MKEMELHQIISVFNYVFRAINIVDVMLSRNVQVIIYLK